MSVCSCQRTALGIIPQVGREPGAEQGGEERDLRKGAAGGKGEMAWNLLSRPGWLTERPQGSCCVHLPSTEITRVCHHTWHFFFILPAFIVSVVVV